MITKIVLLFYMAASPTPVIITGYANVQLSCYDAALALGKAFVAAGAPVPQRVAFTCYKESFS